MSKKDDLLHNNEQDDHQAKKAKSDKSSTQASQEPKASQPVSESNDFTNDDGIIDLDLYHQITSTLFNSLSNPIVRNEIKVNENILKYIELQISNLFFIESALSKQLSGKKLAKEFLQLTANITDLALTVNKSPKKTALTILEDRNLLIVTIINSCKGVERESLDKVQTVDSDSFKMINNQIAALSHFSTDEDQTSELNQQSGNNFDQNNEQPRNFNQQPVNPNMQNMNNMDLNNLSRLGMLPQNPIQSPRFYPYLTKPKVIPILKKVLAGMLVTSILFIVMMIISSTFVKGSLVLTTEGRKIDFLLSKSNNWLILIMTMILYAAFAYTFVKPVRSQRDKYHLSYFILGLLLVWLIITISYFFYQTTDNYYTGYFKANLDSDKKEVLNSNIVSDMKNLTNFTVFQVFSYISATISILPLLIIIVLILINPKLDRNKVNRAAIEYQNAINAALSGKKYDMDQSIFDKDEPAKTKKKSRNKAQFSGWF